MFLKNPIICLFILIFLIFINSVNLKKSYHLLSLIFFSFFIVSLGDLRTAPAMIISYLIIGFLFNAFKRIDRIMLTALVVVAFIFIKGLIAPTHIMGLSYFGLMIIGYFYRNKEAKIIPQTLEPIHALSFFGTATAGPIQKIELSNKDFKNYYRGFFTIALGIIHLTLGELVSELALETFQSPTMTLMMYVTHALTILSYMYFDFQGYTLLAQGLGHLFNLEIPENFDAPYFSTSIREFWRKWHITLGQFFMEHFYMPLQIFIWNRWGRKLNLASGTISKICFFTMWILIGLWHELNIKFLIWGLYNAILILFTVESFVAVDKNSKLQKYVLIILNMSLVLLGQILFLSSSVKEFSGYFQKLSFNYDPMELSNFILSFIPLILCFILQASQAKILILRQKCEESFWWFWITVSLGIFFTMYFAVSGKVFIYSRF